MLSVDPAELDPTVLALPNVVHVRKVIQAATGVLHDLLAEEASPPPTRKSEGGGGVGGRHKSGRVQRSSSGIVASPPNTSPATFSPTAESVLSGGAVAPAVPRAGMGDAQVGNVQGAELVVSDMNAEPTVVADVLLAAMTAGLARPGAVLVVTFKDFCGRHKRMRDEVASAVARLQAGAAEGAGGTRDGGDALMGAGGVDEAGASIGLIGDGNDATASSAFGVGCSSPRGGAERAGAGGVGGVRDRGVCTPPAAGSGGWWRLEGIKTMKLLAGGQSEVTIIAKVAYEEPAVVGHGGGEVVRGCAAPGTATAQAVPFSDS